MTKNIVTEATIAEHEATIAKLSRLAESLDEPTVKADVLKSIQNLSAAVEKLKEEMYGNLNALQTAQIARHVNRPSTLDLIKYLCEKDFIELHGDRLFSDDTAIVTGFGMIGSHKVMIVGHQKGRDVENNVYRNFGMPHPEGYRKALRAMKLAERFSLPIVTFIDTPGAFPGIGAEERGQSTAIAECLAEMSELRVPIISIVTGEGGSGGALALGVADMVFMFRYSVYSVISPEGCASILWHDGKKADEAAEALRIKASHLLELGVIDDILDEPIVGMNGCHEKAAEEIIKVIEHNLPILKSMTIDDLVKKRYEKFRSMGKYCRQEELDHAQKG